jgi:hypothetical protein
MLHSAEPIDVDEALRIGLVNTKTAKGLGLDAGLALEIELVTKIYGTQDKQKGISVFLEKAKAQLYLFLTASKRRVNWQSATRN